MIKFAWRVLLVEFDAMYLFFSVIYRTLKELFPQNLMAKLKPIETYELTNQQQFEQYYCILCESKINFKQNLGQTYLELQKENYQDNKKMTKKYL